MAKFRDDVLAEIMNPTNWHHVKGFDATLRYDDVKLDYHAISELIEELKSKDFMAWRVVVAAAGSNALVPALAIKFIP